MRRWLGLLLACLLAATQACDNGAERKPVHFDGEVRLAVAVPLSGDLADFGQTIADGVRLAANEQNSRGGLLGKKVVVEAFDDKADVETAKSVAEQVVASGARAVIGHFNSSQSIAAAPIYAEGGVLQVTPTSTNPALTEAGIPTVFRVAPTDRAQGPKLAELIVGDGHRRPAFLYQAGSKYAEGLVQYTQDALRQGGVAPAAVESFAKGTKDWATQLEAIRASSPDALVIVCEAPQAAEIVRQAREMGLDLPVYGGDSLAKQEFLFRAGSTANGATITALLPNLVSGPKQDTTLVDSFRSAFGRNPGIDTPAAMAAAQVWFKGVEKAKTTDAEAVAKALKAGFVYDSPIGKISYDDKGDLEDQVLYVNVVSGSQFVQR